MARRLIVNADDFGYSEGVNRGILEAHARGIVTSTSLMVLREAATAAAAMAADHPKLSIGLHLDFGEWEYRDGGWVCVDQVLETSERDLISHEVDRQLAAFRRLVGRDPTHLDSHQHVHLSEPFSDVVSRLGSRLGVCVRAITPGITYEGGFYGQGARGEPHPEWISLDALLALLRRIPEGVTELGCHPGDPRGLRSTYLAERALELQVLCDPEVRAALARERIELWGFADVGRRALPH